MRLLVDTCTFLWTALDSANLSSEAAEQIEDPANDVLLSAVSAWEISLKYALAKLSLPKPPEDLVASMRKRLGIESLAVDEESALAIRRLPALHRDPFDRMLVCQAITHGLIIVTPDPLLRQYPVRTLW